MFKEKGMIFLFFFSQMILEGGVSKVALVSVTEEGKSLSSLCLYVYSLVMIYVFFIWYHELERKQYSCGYNISITTVMFDEGTQLSIARFSGAKKNQIN